MSIYCRALLGRQTAILSDGTVVCSCYDKRKTNPLGNVTQQSFKDIWNNAKYNKTIDRIAKGEYVTDMCHLCHFLVRDIGTDIPQRKIFPEKLIFEYNANCNLSCPGCDRIGITKNRNVQKMDETILRHAYQAIEEIKDHLTDVGFYNHGEPFLYEDSPYVLKEIKRIVGDQTVVMTSTNGTLIDKNDIYKQIIKSGIDKIVFSIDGIDEKTYQQYRKGGEFRKAIENMKKTIAYKKSLNLTKPIIIWRYIIFNYNDSEAMLQKAANMSKQFGVDRMCFLATDFPSYLVSPRFPNGLAGTKWESYQFGVF